MTGDSLREEVWTGSRWEDDGWDAVARMLATGEGDHWEITETLAGKTWPGSTGIVNKHGRHDQRSHGKWAVGRGGSRDGRTRSGRRVRSGTGRLVRVLGDPAEDPSVVEEAVRRMKAGEIVEFDDAGHVHTFVTELAVLSQRARDEGGKLDIDLCQVSVPGTNVFCTGNLGIERADMPQLSGRTVEGSRARREAERQDSTKPVAEREVKIGEQFTEALTDMGVGVRERTMPASQLRASQSQLVGANVAWMMTDPGYARQLREGRIFVSRDGYVIDGHHRWAALVGLDLADGVTGDVDIDVVEVDMPISEALQYANEFAADYGIAPKEG